MSGFLDWLKQKVQQGQRFTQQYRSPFSYIKQRYVQPTYQRYREPVRQFVKQYPSPAHFVAPKIASPIERGVNRLAVRSAGPQYSNWVQDLYRDYKKRGFIQASQDLTNPWLQNPRIKPHVEPFISGMRASEFALLHPKEYLKLEKGRTEPIEPQYRIVSKISDKIAQVSNFLKDNPNPPKYIKTQIQEYFQSKSKEPFPNFLKKVTEITALPAKTLERGLIRPGWEAQLGGLETFRKRMAIPRAELKPPTPEEKEKMAGLTMTYWGGKTEPLKGQVARIFQKVAQKGIKGKALQKAGEKLVQKGETFFKPMVQKPPTITPKVVTPKAEIKRVADNISKNNPGITRRDAEAMAKDVIANRKITPSVEVLPPKVVKPTTIKPKVVKPEVPLRVEEYVLKQKSLQEKARGGGPTGIISKVKSFVGEIKRKLVDYTAPIEDTLAMAERKLGVKLKPSEYISSQIDRVLRSPTLAGQFVKDKGLDKIIREVPDIDVFNQYLIAKQASRVEGLGKATGRNLAKDKKLINELSSTYEPYAQKVKQYTDNLLDYITEGGIVSPETNKLLKKKYPDYVPLNRIFDELEQPATKKISGGVAHLGQQTIIKKLKGSERVIEDPITSILAKTNDAFRQVEKNKTARLLASYKDKISIFKPLLNEVKAGRGGVNSFSFFDNGIKRTFETTPEIAEAAKNLDAQQFGLLGKIFALPTRIARIGITGLNIPFIASNIARDQVTAFINSKNAIRTSFLNPVNFGRAIFEAVAHGKLYDDMVRNAAGWTTSYDIARTQAPQTIEKIRAGKDIGSKILYTAKHPQELLRYLENVVSRGEELTRIQQFAGTRNALLKQGLSETEASIGAAKASREASINFARHGSWGKVLNSAFLYINAGIQGSRTFMRNIYQRPVQTMIKTGVAVMTPLAAVTVWNLSDEKRRLVYQDISEYEKQNNLILIPPNPTRDEEGRWNVVKIPLSQEIAPLTSPVRKTIEGVAGFDYPGFGDFANSFFQTATSIDVSTKEKISSTLTPQAIKPALEALTNKVFFTGKDIVPDYLKEKPVQEQVYKTTSGTARKVGQFLKTSPLKVEQITRGYLGGVGSQIINISDRVLAHLGVIPKEQIGGEGIWEGITRRFSKAYGGEIMKGLSGGKNNHQVVADFIEKFGNDKDRQKLFFATKDEIVKLLSPEEQNSFNRWFTQKDKTTGRWETISKAADLLSNPKVVQAQTQLQRQIYLDTGKEIDPFYLLSPQQQQTALLYQTREPGSKDKSKIIKANPWIKSYWDIRSDYFKRIGFRGGGDAPNKYY